MSTLELLTALQQIVNVWYPLPLVDDPQAEALALSKAYLKPRGELHCLAVVGDTGPVGSREALARAGSRPMSFYSTMGFCRWPAGGRRLAARRQHREPDDGESGQASPNLRNSQAVVGTLFGLPQGSTPLEHHRIQMSLTELINHKDVRAQNKNHDEHNDDPLSHLLPGGKADHLQLLFHFGKKDPDSCQPRWLFHLLWLLRINGNHRHASFLGPRQRHPCNEAQAASKQL